MDSVIRNRRPAPGPAVTGDEPKPGPGSTAIRRTEPELTLMNLPPELHFAISKYLIYPDALSLKHSNRHFYSLVDTGTRLKVEWLLERRSLHLECPNDRRCDLGSDLRFCRGSVPLLMRRRREHIECDSRPGLGCLVFGTKRCTHKQRQSTWKRWLGTKLTIELWWILLAAVPLIFFWKALLELMTLPQRADAA